MKKFMKILLVAVLSVMLICSFAFADNPFEGHGGSDNTGGVEDAVADVGAMAIDIVQTVGYIMAVIMVLVVGIQWVMATPAKKQELKGRMWNIVIGAALIVGGVTFLGIISDTVDGLNLGGGTGGSNGTVVQPNSQS